MSDVATPKKAALWPEALRLFRLHEKTWVKWAVLFGILVIPLDIWISRGTTEINDALMAILRGDQQAAAHPPPSPPGHFLISVAMMLVGYFQMYVYSTLFLKQESNFGFPTISFKGFLLYIWQIVLWFLLFGVCCIAYMIVAIIASIVLSLIVPQTAFMIIMGILIAAPILCFMCVAYTLIFPLAACRTKSPFKTGLRLLRGNILRLFINIIPVWLVVALFIPLDMLLLSKIEGLLGDTGSPDRGMVVLAGVLSLLLMSFLQIVVSGISTAFGCATCAVFVREKQADDPAFKLITSP